MGNQQPEALILANDRPSAGDGLYQWALDAEDMIRRQHDCIQELEAMLESIGAGGVSAQRVTQPVQAREGAAEKALTDLREHYCKGCGRIGEIEELNAQDKEKLRKIEGKPKTVAAPVLEIPEAAPQPQADARDAAWSDLKIAFDIPDGEDETLWKCVESGAITLPNGWKLIETTGAGGVGPVAVFRTEHLPTSSETFVVGSAINYAIAAAKGE